MSQTVFCIADDNRQAHGIVAQLKSAGFSSRNISVVLRDNRGAPYTVDGRYSSASGMSSSAIDSLDTSAFFAGGPIVRAPGSTGVDEIAQALVKLGVQPADARRLEDAVESGRILLIISSPGRRETDRVKQICAESGASAITSMPDSKHRDAAVKSPSIPQGEAKRRSSHGP